MGERKKPNNAKVHEKDMKQTHTQALKSHLLARPTQSFPKEIKIALEENTLILFSFSGLQVPGQAACKTCSCSTYEQLIWAESSRQVFSICFEIRENQPAANSSQKSQISTKSGIKNLQHQHRAPLPTFCPTGSCIPLLHLQTSLSHVSTLLNYVEEPESTHSSSSVLQKKVSTKTAQGQGH